MGSCYQLNFGQGKFMLIYVHLVLLGGLLFKFSQSEVVCHQPI